MPPTWDSIFSEINIKKYLILAIISLFYIFKLLKCRKIILNFEIHDQFFITSYSKCDKNKKC